MLVIEALDSKGFGFKSGGIWYNVPKGVVLPPKGSVVAGNIVQGTDNQGRPRYSLQGFYVVQQAGGDTYAPAPAPAPAQQQAVPAPAYQPQQPQGQGYKKPYTPKGNSSYNNDRSAHDTSAEQKLRYNALTLAVAFDKGGSVDSMVAVAGQLYEVIKNGFVPAQVPVQQAAVQQRMQPAPKQPPVQYSAFEQPAFDDDDLPFDGQ
jgi:hypothetical protein